MVHHCLLKEYIRLRSGEPVDTPGKTTGAEMLRLIQIVQETVELVYGCSLILRLKLSGSILSCERGLYHFEEELTFI